MSSTPVPSSPDLVDAFLSHVTRRPASTSSSTTSPRAAATIAFRVDRGRFPTSTTRLERMIRDADAFVEFWPLTDEAALVTAIRGSRRRAVLPARAGYGDAQRKPGIVFADKRYAGLVRTPEIAARASTRRRSRWRRLASGCAPVRAVGNLGTDFTLLPRCAFEDGEWACSSWMPRWTRRRERSSNSGCAPVGLPHAAERGCTGGTTAMRLGRRRHRRPHDGGDGGVLVRKAIPLRRV